MQYKILRLAKGGFGISQTDGKTWFIEGALPDETGTAQILEEKQRYGKARAITRDNNAPCRSTQNTCPCAHQCDGCGFRHVKPEYALELKSQAVHADILRNARLSDVPYTCIGLKDNQLDHTRRRVRLHIQDGKVGYFSRGTHHMISAAQCVVIVPELQSAIAWLEAHLAQAHIPPLARLDVQMDLDAQNRVYAHFKTVQERVLKRHQHRPGKKLPSKPAEISLDGLKKWAKAAISDGIFAGIRVENQTFGIPMIEDRIGDDLVVYRQIGDFAQATAEANAAIHALVSQFIQETGAQFVADLYSGSGNLTFRAACHAPRVVASEFFCSKDAFDKGLKDNEERLVDVRQVSLVQADLSQGLPQQAVAADVMICDPARDGLSEAIIQDICQARASHILYVSCEASCLARDITRFAPTFALQKLAFIDMFPQTPHVETVAWFKRM